MRTMPICPLYPGTETSVQETEIAPFPGVWIAIVHVDDNDYHFMDCLVREEGLETLASKSWLNGYGPDCYYSYERMVMSEKEPSENFLKAKLSGWRVSRISALNCSQKIGSWKKNSIHLPQWMDKKGLDTYPCSDGFAVWCDQAFFTAISVLEKNK